jgi:hypothetical protein
MFNDVENFGRFFQRSILGFFRNYQIDIDIGMDEISVRGTPNCSFDSHQTMLLLKISTSVKYFGYTKLKWSYFGSLENGFLLEVFRMTRSVCIGFDPADVFASPESPSSQAHTPQV